MPPHRVVGRVHWNILNRYSLSIYYVTGTVHMLQIYQEIKQFMPTRSIHSSGDVYKKCLDSGVEETFNEWLLLTNI